MTLKEDFDNKYDLYRKVMLENCRCRAEGRWNQMRYDIEARHYTYPLINLIDSYGIPTYKITTPAIKAVKAVKAVAAVEAVEAVEASEGVEAVEAVAAVEAIEAVEEVEGVKEFTTTYYNKAIDIACGHGTTSLYLNLLGYDTYAMDINDINPPLDYFIEKDIKFSRQDITKGLGTDEEFSLIVFAEILEHLFVPPVPVLTQIGKRLTKDGMIIISTPDRDGKWDPGILQEDFGVTHWSQIVELPFLDDSHYYIYTKDEILQLCTLCGLEVVYLESIELSSGRNHLYCVAKQASLYKAVDDPTMIDV